MKYQATLNITTNSIQVSPIPFRILSKRKGFILRLFIHLRRLSSLQAFNAWRILAEVYSFYRVKKRRSAATKVSTLRDHQEARSSRSSCVRTRQGWRWKEILCFSRVLPIAIARKTHPFSPPPRLTWPFSALKRETRL